MAKTPSRLRSALTWAALSLSPLTAAAAGLALMFLRGSFYLGRNSDPDYQYLLNALMPLAGAPPRIIVHPGTPLALLGSGVVALTHAIFGHGPAVDDALSRPELFLTAWAVALAVIYAGCLLWAGWIVHCATGRLSLALLTQSAPWLGVDALGQVAKVGPEALLLSIMTLLGAAVVRQATRRQNHDHDARTSDDLWLFSALAGVALATKATAFIALLIPLLLVRTMTRRAVFLLLSAAFFLLATSPILTRYPLMYRWMMGIVTETGYHGGDGGLLQLGRYVDALDLLVRREPVFFLVLGLSVLALAALVFIRRTVRALWSTPWATAFSTITAAEVLLTLSVIKTTEVRYLIPASALLGVNLALLVKLVAWEKLGPKPARVGLGVTLALLFVVVQANRHYYRTQGYILTRLTLRETERFVGQHPDCLVIYDYPSTAPACALWRGEVITERFFAQDLQRLYPEAVCYDQGPRGFFNFSGAVSIDELRLDERCVLLVGYAYEQRPERRRPMGVSLQKLHENYAATVYRVLPMNQGVDHTNDGTSGP